MLKAKLLISLVLLFSLISNHVLAEVIVLRYDDLPMHVKENNQNVKAKKNLRKASKARTNHLSRSFLPEVNALGGVQNYKSGTFNSRTDPYLSINSSINLFRSGKDYLENKIRRYEHQISMLNLNNEYLKQLTEARYHYLHSIYYSNRLTTKKIIYSEAQSLIRQTRAKIQTGLVSQSELGAIRLYADRLQAEIILLEEDFEHTIDELKVALGLSLNTKVKVKLQHNLVHGKHSFSAHDVTNNPALLKLQALADVSNEKSKKHNRWWAPEIDVYGSYNIYTFPEREYASITDRDEYVVGAQIKIPFFDKLTSHSEGKSEKFRKKALDKEAGYLKSKLEALVKKQLHGLKIRHKLLHNSERTLNTARSYISKLKEEFQNGVKNSTDIISAYEAFDLRSQNFNEYTKEYFTLEANLLALIGGDNHNR